jgi:hypothetical protein
MTQSGPWTTEDFETLSWHDVHVHGLRLDTFRESEGSADLVLDIDYILQWHKTGTSFEFTICPATLRFHEVFALRVSLDYAGPTAGMCPFSIDGIERERLVFPTGFTSYRWRIPVNWPRGEIEFQAPGFTQMLAGTPRLHSRQWLAPETRANGRAA